MADWKQAAQSRPPQFAVRALHSLNAHVGHAVVRAIRTNSFANTVPRYYASHLTALFGCCDQPHAFDAPNHSWAWFREPQITAGLAHFLQAGPFELRRERVKVFLAAAYEAAGQDHLLEQVVTADFLNTEAVAEENRVDLIIDATTQSGNRLGLVVEAKFGHHLTPNQLPAARRHAAARGLSAENSAFLIILPHRADVGSRVFAKTGNRGWCAVSWWALLVAFERRFAAATDDDAFRSFRHTVWHQSYGERACR